MTTLSEKKEHNLLASKAVNNEVFASRPILNAQVDQEDRKSVV